MSIPALGGGAGGHGLQRALMDAAERALADELGLLEGEQATAGAASSPNDRAVRRRPATPAESGTPVLDEAIVVELGEADQADRLEVAGGWITVPKRGPLETKAEPEARRLDGSDVKGAGAPPAQQPGTPTAGQVTGRVPGQPAGQTPGSAPGAGQGSAPTPPEAPAAGMPAQASAPGAQAPTEAAASSQAGAAAAKPAPQPGETVSLDRLIVVLKRTGIGFRDAYQVLRQIGAGEPLPPRAELQARWAAADPAAWEERARVRAQATPQDPAQQARPADVDLRQTPIDDLIRDRSWHKANAAAADASAEASAESQTRAADRSERTDRPTLQSITRQDTTNQAYVAGLSTAEFQRLVTVLGLAAPAWFWDLRGHRGLRGLAERPTIAKLNATQIAGTRLAAWILAIVGMALFWYLGIRTNIWW